MTPNHKARAAVTRKSQAVPEHLNRSKIHPGYQWGEPIDQSKALEVERMDEELRVRAAIPSYLSQHHPCDFIQQYETARYKRPAGQQRTGKISPHIRFANARSDHDLINFVREFGPVVATSYRMMPSQDLSLPKATSGGHRLQIAISACQNLAELRVEQKIYSAALGLILELAKADLEFDFEFAQKQVGEIADGIQEWPGQWERERKERGEDPLWRVPGRSIGRIMDQAKGGRDLFLPAKLGPRIVICELLNMFPSLDFPNPPEMHTAIHFGIRFLLYSVLRREHHHHRDTGICANTQCRDFFEIERGGQQYCDDECSRQQRQRDYWQQGGKERRQQRLAMAKCKKRNNGPPR